jgi:hypothetical protein
MSRLSPQAQLLFSFSRASVLAFFIHETLFKGTMTFTLSVSGAIATWLCLILTVLSLAISCYNWAKHIPCEHGSHSRPLQQLDHGPKLAALVAAAEEQARIMLLNQQSLLQLIELQRLEDTSNASQSLQRFEGPARPRTA